MDYTGIGVECSAFKWSISVIAGGGSGDYGRRGVYGREKDIRGETLRISGITAGGGVTVRVYLVTRMLHSVVVMSVIATVVERFLYT